MNNKLHIFVVALGMITLQRLNKNELHTAVLGLINATYTYASTHTHTHKHAYIHIYMSSCLVTSRIWNGVGLLLNYYDFDLLQMWPTCKSS